jgi:hypothetical protein
MTFGSSAYQLIKVRSIGRAATETEYTGLPKTPSTPDPDTQEPEVEYLKGRSAISYVQPIIPHSWVR